MKEIHVNKGPNWRRKSTALTVGTCLALLCAASSIQAAGIHKLALNSSVSSPTANFISAPFTKSRIWRGSVDSVAGNVVTVEGATLPSNLGRRDGDGNLDVAGYAQYIVILRWDASATISALGNAGDWWYIESNTGTTLTLAPGFQGPSVSLAAGDRFEIIPLTSYRDIFGGPGGTTTILNKDNNGGSSLSEEDVIYSVNGTSFGSDTIFHDGTLTGGVEGYIVGGSAGPFDGQFLTIGPDEAIFTYRKGGTSATSAISVGTEHRAPVTHYAPSGVGSVSVASSFGTAFPVDALLINSGLSSVGMIEDSNGGASPFEEDVLYQVVGTSFANEIIRHDGTLNGGIKLWLIDGNDDPTFTIQSGGGLFFYRRPNLTTLFWRESVPFSL